jgi:hypothetical protein
MTGVTLTIHDQAQGIAPTRDYTYECHSPTRLAEIVQGTVAVMPDTARITAIHVH